MKKEFKTVVAEVKQAHSITEYIESSGVSLVRAGTNKWKGLCPFHSEKTPSFIVDDNFQNYRCFGCGVNGDIIKFIQETEHLDFMDVLKKLAEEKNIELEFGEKSSSSIDYTSLRKILKDTANFYVKNFRRLPNDHIAKQEVLERGLSLNKTHYGYALEKRTSLYDHLKSQGYSDDLIVQAGVVTKFDNGNIVDFWNGRLIFVITDIRGRPIGFSGRRLYEGDRRGKYVNSKDGVLYNKSESLYNLSNARVEASKSKKIFVTEGQFDVAAFVEAGMVNTVASSGTAFTEQQALSCRRIVGETGRIIFAFDGDRAGRDAALHVFNQIPIVHSQSLVVVFPEDKDPSDYRAEYGDEEFIEFIDENTVPMVEFVLDEIAEKFDLDEELEKAEYIKEASEILRQIASNTLREVYIKRVALTSFVSVDVIKKSIKEVDRGVRKRSHGPEELTHTEVEEVVDSPLINKILTDPVYDMYARMIKLAVHNEALLSRFPSLVKFLPEDLREFGEELSNTRPPLIPEKFEETDLFEFIVNQDGWFPLSSLMSDEELFTHFKYLFNRVKGLEKEKNAKSVRRKISKILEKTIHPDDLKLLKHALRKESEALS